MEYDGGYCEKKNVYMCMVGSLCCTAKINRKIKIKYTKIYIKISKEVALKLPKRITLKTQSP